MTKLINKPAGFWIRFLARFLDIVIFIAILIGTAFAFLVKSAYQFGPSHDIHNSPIIYAAQYHFESVGNYYGWIIISIITLLVLFILIPMFTNGRTLWMMVFRIKIDFNEDKSKPWIKRFAGRFLPLIKREMFTSLTLVINMVLVLALFDKDIFNKFTYFSKKRMTEFEDNYGIKSSDIFTTWDNLRIAIVTTFASILFVTQMVMALSIIVRKQRLGLHDSFSKTRTIWESRKIELKDNQTEEQVTSFRPRLVKREPIEWLD